MSIEVRDWGSELEPEELAEGQFGLTSIRVRTRLLGGDLVIESKPGNGTCLRVTFPLLSHVRSWILG